jgi:hypothetical protein
MAAGSEALRSQYPRNQVSPADRHDRLRRLCSAALACQLREVPPQWQAEPCPGAYKLGFDHDCLAPEIRRRLCVEYAARKWASSRRHQSGGRERRSLGVVDPSAIVRVNFYAQYSQPLLSRHRLESSAFRVRNTSLQAASSLANSAITGAGVPPDEFEPICRHGSSPPLR